jgi:hypothetical protein
VSATIQQIGVFVLAAVSLIAVGVLAIISHPIPNILDNITYVTVGGAVGVALPNATTAGSAAKAPTTPVA